jgi:2-iminobutanoate/2-iminopropanoate deaminase
MKPPVDDAPEPFYSMTRRAGSFLYLSGFGPVDADLNVVGSDIAEQARYTMDRMQEALAGAEATWADVVRVNVFLADLADRDEFNAAYARYFDGPKPTRRLIGAGSLYKGILVEIDCIAYLEEES